MGLATLQAGSPTNSSAMTEVDTEIKANRQAAVFMGGGRF
jgi:hypothetical protein